MGYDELNGGNTRPGPRESSMSDITEDIFADEIADPCDDCGAAAGVMCDCVLEGIFGPKSGA